MTRLSIIVSFFQRIAHLRCCLAALERCRQDFHEVIIADDGSEAAVVEQVRRLADTAPFPVRHVWQPKDGFRLSANRNNGIRAASGDHLPFIDCDFVLLPGAVRAHLDMARPGRFTAAYCKYLPESPSAQLLQDLPGSTELEVLYEGLESRPILRAHRKFIWNSILIRLGLTPPRKLRCSSHFSISRKDMETINGYDEQFRGWGGEDEDLALRMVLAGYQPRSVISGARTLHVWHPSELGNVHWSNGSNVTYLNRSGVTARCKHGLVSGPV